MSPSPPIFCFTSVRHLSHFGSRRCVTSARFYILFPLLYPFLLLCFQHNLQNSWHLFIVAGLDAQMKTVKTADESFKRFLTFLKGQERVALAFPLTILLLSTRCPRTAPPLRPSPSCPTFLLTCPHFPHQSSRCLTSPRSSLSVHPSCFDDFFGFVLECLLPLCLSGPVATCLPVRYSLNKSVNPLPPRLSALTSVSPE